PVINGIVDSGGDTLVTEAAKCQDKITAISLDAAKETFTCLGQALKTAGKSALVGIAKGLWDEFIKLLNTGCGKATEKLRELAGKLAAAIPQVKSMVEPVVSAIGTACQGGVEKVSNIKLPLP